VHSAHPSVRAGSVCGIAIQVSQDDYKEHLALLIELRDKNVSSVAYSSDADSALISLGTNVISMARHIPGLSYLAPIAYPVTKAASAVMSGLASQTDQVVKNCKSCTHENKTGKDLGNIKKKQANPTCFSY